MVNLPTSKERAADIPPLPFPIRRQDESALPRTHQHPYSAHLILLFEFELQKMRATIDRVQTPSGNARPSISFHGKHDAEVRCYRGLCRVVLITFPCKSYVRHSPTFLSFIYSPSS